MVVFSNSKNDFLTILILDSGTRLENSQLKVLSLWVLGTGWNNIYLISIMIAMFDIYDLWKHLKVDGGLEIVSLSGYLKLHLIF